MYDTFDYDTMLREWFNNPESINSIAARQIQKTLDSVAGLTVCDLCCGEGFLSRWLADQGASVVGVDLSFQLLKLARQRSPTISLVRDDAQRLSSIIGNSFDLVVCHLALMDIPDLDAIYAAVYRVLRPNGRFVFMITHPCFLSPHSTIDEATQSRIITHYTHEGFWRSSNSTGLRGRVGAYHRTLATYLNGIIRAGFEFHHIEEPPIGEIPLLLTVDARKTTGLQ
jgi:2-polyprenyl-3-methyl-5-hydroxy-6-metoxy-1,4-benzoquinol methylase